MHIDHPMPKCTYSLRHNGVDGPAATFARVGDPVVHSFVCDNGTGILCFGQKALFIGLRDKLIIFKISDISTYAMLVRDCTVSDGKENIKKLIDHNGCPLDDDLMRFEILSINQSNFILQNATISIKQFGIIRSRDSLQVAGITFLNNLSNFQSKSI